MKWREGERGERDESLKKVQYLYLDKHRILVIVVRWKWDGERENFSFEL